MGFEISAPKKGSSRNLVAWTWVEIELTAIEQDSYSVVFKISKSSCCGLDRLDSAVEAFGRRVGDAMTKVTQ